MRTHTARVTQPTPSNSQDRKRRRSPLAVTLLAGACFLATVGQAGATSTAPSFKEFADATPVDDDGTYIYDGDGRCGALRD